MKAALDFQATEAMTLEFLVGNIAARSKFALGVICCLPIQITAASSLLDLQVKSDLLVALAGLQGFLFACQTYFLGTKRGVEVMKQISCIIFWKGAKMFCNLQESAGGWLVKKVSYTNSPNLAEMCLKPAQPGKLAPWKRVVCSFLLRRRPLLARH